MTRGGGAWGRGCLGAGWSGGSRGLLGAGGRHALCGSSRAVDSRVPVVECEAGTAVLLGAAGIIKSEDSLAFGHLISFRREAMQHKREKGLENRPFVDHDG